jgi:cytochrome o ubiquinol oxidase subunit IV
MVRLPHLHGRARYRGGPDRDLLLGRQHIAPVGAGVPLGLAVFAIAQMGIHLVFFLHITTGPDNTNNVLALAFGLLIVALAVGGSLWIMANLNANMPPVELMNLHAQP